VDTQGHRGREEDKRRTPGKRSGEGNMHNGLQLREDANGSTRQS